MEGSKIKGCVINRIWFEQAEQMLSNPAERCWFYETIMKTTFGMPTTNPPSQTCGVMFAMVKPYIEEDVKKYETRCETNRANAQKKRIGAIGCDSVRLGANGCDTKPMEHNINTNTNSNTNNNTNNNLSPERAENKEKWDCMGIIFAKDAKYVTDEVKAFWNYYDSLGWRNKNGSPIVRKTSCARMWRVGGELAGEGDWREKWYRAFKTAETTDPTIWTQVRKIVPEERENGRVLVIFSNGGESWVQRIEANFTAQLAALVAAYGASGVEYRVR